jgi:hypothetical protein
MSELRNLAEQLEELERVVAALWLKVLILEARMQRDAMVESGGLLH